MYLRKLFLTIVFLLCGVGLTQAHPLDISVSVFSIDSETEKISASTYLHPFEVGYLLEEKAGAKIVEFSEIFQYKDLIFDYIRSSISLDNNGVECQFVAANIPPKDEFEIMGGGLEVQYELQCSEALEILEFENTLFVDDFELQTNKMLFYQDQKYEQTMFEKILTSKITSESFDYRDPGRHLYPDQDTDGDGLTDREEVIYFTDLNNPDTDYDGHSDKVEIDGGFDPRNPVASTGQMQIVSVEEAEERRVAVLLEDLETRKTRENTIPQPRSSVAEEAEEDVAEKNIMELVADDVDQSESSDDANQEDEDAIVVTTIDVPSEQGAPEGSEFFGTTFLRDALKHIQIIFESDSFFLKLFVLFLAYLLGLLHSLEPGHGKSILISYLADHHKDMRDAFRFSGFMTMTHLVDVVVLGILFQIFSMTNDAFGVISVIQKWGVYILLFISISLLLRAIFDIHIPKLFKNGKALGIASGLAPCTIGWALMIVMLSIGQIHWLIPVIIFFGLGIFSSLILMSFVIIKLKNKFVAKSSTLARVSSLLSAILLFLSALVLMQGI